MQIQPGSPIYNSLAAPDTAGTVGGIVRNDLGEDVLLTCFHAVYQPGMSWGKFQFSESLCNCTLNEETKNFGSVDKALRDEVVDIAIIKGADNFTFNKEIPEIGIPNGKCALSGKDIRKVKLRKFGAVTKYTSGFFDGFMPMFGSRYPGGDFHYLHYLIKIITPDGKPFSKKGDSGSFVLNQKNEVAGVIVMGDGHTSFAIQAGFIESRLNISFL